jgi:drug/metabolite transporter (DMT)-like permease
MVAMPKCDANTVEMAGWIVAYCISSSSMTILNKAAIKAFNFPFWLCTLQNLATLLVLAFIVSVAPKGHKIFGLKTKYDSKIVLTWTPAAIMFCVMLVSAMSAMQTMSVTTVLVTRSLTPLVTLILEVYMLGVTASFRIWLSLFSILGGSVFYCLAEIEGTLVGYIWLGVNLLAAAAYHVYVKKVINELKLSTMDMVLYNNLMSIPLLIAIGIVADDTRHLARGFETMDGLAWLWVSLSLVCAGFISFTGFGMQAIISATSSTVVNHINKVNSFIFAHLIFEDTINPLMVVGIVITMLGTVWYSIERLNERKNEAAAKAIAPEAVSSEKTPLRADKSKGKV